MNTKKIFEIIYIILIFLVLFLFYNITNLTGLFLIPITFGIVYLFMIVLIIIGIIGIVISCIKKEKTYIVINIVLVLIQTIFIIFFARPVFDYIHVKKEITRAMKNDFKTSYKIINKNKGIYENDSLDSCKVYNVKLDDDKDITFQAYYCSPKYGMWTSYEVYYNYLYYYLPIYLDEFNKENATNLKVEMSLSDKYLLSEVTMSYTSIEEKNNICNFLKYLKENASKYKVKITVYDDTESISDDSQDINNDYRRIDYSCNKKI